MDRMLIMISTYSLLVSFLSASPIPVSNSVKVNATCDDDVVVYADGQELFSNDNSVGEVTSHQLSSCPKVIAIKCQDNSIIGGIIARVGTDQELYTVTDGSWKCTNQAPADTRWTTDNFDDSSWRAAQTINNFVWGLRPLEGITAGISDTDPSSDPQWIWTTNAIGQDRKVYCRKEITACQETVTEPNSNPVTEPATDPVTEPATDPVTDPVTNSPTEPLVTETTTVASTTTQAATTGYNCDNNNPCNPLEDTEKFHYPHQDTDKYVQCSADGRCFVMPCPPGLVWNDAIMACTYAI